MAQLPTNRPKMDITQDAPRESHLTSRPAATSGGIRNLLSEDVEILGTITFSDNLTIEGKVLGDVISRGDLTIGEHAFVKGNIHARTAVVHGRVEGNIAVEGRCEAGETANITGDVSALTFSIREGAALAGRTRIGKSAAAAPAKI